MGHEWHEAFFGRCLAAGRLAHAYLFHGEEGLGKRAFARRLAGTVHCARRGDGSAAAGGEGGGAPGFGGCGRCRPCVQMEGGTHPDFWETGGTGGAVRREQVEEAVRFLWLRPVAGPRRVAVMADADLLTPEAAAALLKVLEEPPVHSLVVLVAASASSVPATLRSRCQAVAFRPVQPEAIAHLVAARTGIGQREAVRLSLLARGRPGVALRLAVEPTWRQLWGDAERILAKAEETAREGPAAVPALGEDLGRFLGKGAQEPWSPLDVLAVCVRERLGTGAPAPLAGSEASRDASAAGGGVALDALVGALAAVLEARSALEARANRRLVADVLAWRLTEALSTAGRLLPRLDVR